MLFCQINGKHQFKKTAAENNRWKAAHHKSLFVKYFNYSFMSAVLLALNTWPGCSGAIAKTANQQPTEAHCHSQNAATLHSRNSLPNNSYFGFLRCLLRKAGGQLHLEKFFSLAKISRLGGCGVLSGRFLNDKTIG